MPGRLRSLLTARSLRLVAGCTVFLYTVTHFLNHALGLIDLEAMERGRLVFLAFWRFPGIGWVAGTALTVHLLLGLFAIAQRPTLRMSRGEWLQVVTGLLIPLMLIGHVFSTRVAHARFGVDDTYAYELLSMTKLGVFYPMLVTAAVVWLHGCLGLWFWLRLKPWFGRVMLPLFALAVLIPTLAIAGSLRARTEVLAQARLDPTYTARVERTSGSSDAIVQASLRATGGATGVYVLLVALAFAARPVRAAWRRRAGSFAQSYPDGRRVQAPIGHSILDASLAAGIPHAHVCGGRGRCSTCRVSIELGFEQLPEMDDAEATVLTRVGATGRVRLACQTRPRTDVAISLLLPPSAGVVAAHGRPRMHGQEREITVLFADLRGFTKLSERHLPYDVVFLLNQYFHTMGAIVEEHGGRVDKFIGDGIMALFGLGDGHIADAGAGGALRAGLAMCRAVESMNSHNRSHISEPLRIGVGVHAGPAIVGEMGYRSTVSVTAIGDTVNTASRLEQATKPLEAVLVASRSTAERAAFGLPDAASATIRVKGKEESLEVLVVRSVV